MINNQEFIRRLSKKIKMSQSISEEIVKDIQELVLELLEEDSKVKISDFLVFKKKEVPEKTYKLPNSNEVKTKESHYKITAKLTEKYQKQPK